MSSRMGCFSFQNTYTSKKKKKSLVSLGELPELMDQRKVQGAVPTGLFSAAAGFSEIRTNSNDNSP